MSKLLPFLVAAAGASTVSVGGNFLLKKGVVVQATDEGNTEGQEQNQQDTPTPTIDKNLGFETLQDFKSQNGGSCVSNHFPQINFSNLSTPPSSFEKLTESSFSSSDSNVQSCLIINWKKTQYTSTTTGETATEKWKGNFSLLWSFVNVDNGFVLFVTTKPFTKDNSIDLEGGLYVINKTNDVWKSEKYKEFGSSSDVTVDDNSFANTFPQPGTGIDAYQQPQWGFISGADELKKVCKETNDTSCGTPKSSSTPLHEAGLWKFSSDQEVNKKKIGEWINKLEDWTKTLFGSEELGLHTAVESFQGTWNKQN